eukprot:09683.XXX_71874_72515_1 [CDS] Oithona nana genome sequencing.
MMMNDFDDEQTMEEEEANEDQDNEEDELAALEQEQDMPIEELLKMYGAVPSGGGESEPAAAAAPPQEVKADEDLSKAADDSKKEEPIANTSKDLVIEEPSGSTTDYDAEAAIGEVSSKRKGSLSPAPPMKKSKSELARFYEAAVEGRALRSQGQPEDMEEEMEDEEGCEDSDSENRDYSWKKTIMIGPSYQASVPADLAIYGDTLPYGETSNL